MDKLYQDTEKRQTERIDVNFVVIYNVNSPLSVRMMVGNQEVVAIAVNLSEGGIAISTNYELPVSTLVKIRFILLNEKSPVISERMKSIEVTGDVRHSFLNQKNVYQIGISFIDLADSERQFIAGFIKLEKRSRQ
ncbi:MAG: PilZ domain-containing protein [Candidatus Omnitrophota bacterium]|jgi:hypothetical protein